MQFYWSLRTRIRFCLAAKSTEHPASCRVNVVRVETIEAERFPNLRLAAFNVIRRQGAVGGRLVHDASLFDNCVCGAEQRLSGGKSQVDFFFLF